ncbi:hypothetical protein VaNZ11_007058 [Volvox africanus]|uniref:AP2/ERF domain-containing protein n=1 Tax=Volvox africanus TaxID=51714 RepID=A0ABQ5S355_9CHLO|nr:hypothetical protein VaNZ11_007058 [Volvox africanus]
MLILEAMGGETGRESSGPIRRFPTGFWASFNLWWHGEYARLGQRPSSRAITKWHAENAMKVWGSNAVSYQETQRHANRMKCRRTGQYAQRHASPDEDDEDDDFCPDVLPSVDLGERDATATATAKVSCGADYCAAAAADQLPSGDGGGSHGSPVKVPSMPIAAPHAKLDAYSDPPGALTAVYMNADSDVPAPAAPSVNLVDHFSSVQPTDNKPTWMQPDPTVHPGLAHGGAGFGQGGCGEVIGRWSPSWDSVLGCRTGDTKAARCSASGQDTGLGYLMDGSRPVKRGRDGAVLPTNSYLQNPNKSGSEQLHPERYLGTQRANPFAEVAAAAAAAAGLPAAHALPAARDAATLLSSVTKASSRLLQRCGPGCEPAWLQRTGTELNALMLEMGLLSAEPNGVAVLPGIVGRPRVLSSTQPLRLPDPSPRRDLDTILRRGLREGNTISQYTPAAVTAAPGTARPQGGVLDRDPRELLLRCHGGVPAQAGPPHGSLWAQAGTCSRAFGSDADREGVSVGVAVRR